MRFALALALILGGVAAVIPVSRAAAQAAAPDAAPSYSLVAARETEHVDRRHMGCMWIGDRVVCPEYRSASYDEARTLAGPAVESRFSISTEVAQGAGWYRPVLLVIRNIPDRQSRVVASATADASGRACIPIAEMDRLGWRPNGPGIATPHDGTCADLSALAALPLPELPVVTVLTAKDLKRELRRQRRRSH
jgi:hypothetical protein